MSQEDGLVCAYLLDGKGGGHEIGWDGIDAWRPEQGTLWVHLDRSAAQSQEWLSRRSGLDSLLVEALLTEETRPRSEPVGDGFLVILRGVNLNPGADPEDMISIRIWVEAGRIITTRKFKMMAVSDVREAITAGRGARSAADLLVALADRLIHRMGPVIDSLEDAADKLEEELIGGEKPDIRGRLADVRREAIALRRYLAPQREAIGRLRAEERPWLDVSHRARLREVGDRLIRYIEDLDALRERASVVQDELMNRLSEQMSRTMYVLTVVAAIMLPLGFLTGLLGINVGGIPGSENPWGFAAVCLLLAGLVAVQVWLFRRLGWI